ncbi:hypothetical protein IPR80_00295 [Xanthomonas perforans]|nr:hypothetical protein [Xanthomonas perforans]
MLQDGLTAKNKKFGDRLRERIRATGSFFMNNHEYGHHKVFINPRLVTSVSAVTSSPSTANSVFTVYLQGDPDGIKLLYGSVEDASAARAALSNAVLS